MLDLHRLRMLRELQHRGTLAAVAAAMSYSPSAVSQQLAQLEVEAGVKLLLPVGRGVRLTPQAEILVAHTDALLERLERAEADLAASLTDVAATVRVAAYQSIALTVVPEVLTELQRSHPLLRVEISQLDPEVALPALLARDFDLALMEEYPGYPTPRPPQIELTRVGEDELLLLQHPGQRPVASLSQLADRVWVMEPPGTMPRLWLTSMCREAGFEPDVRFSSGDLATHLRLVETGHAVTVVPELALLGLHADVARQPLPGRMRRRRVLTAVRAGAGRHPAVAAFRDALTAALQADRAPAPR